MIKLSAQELALYRQCINQVLHGFYAPGMEQTVGVSYAVLMKEDRAFYDLHKPAAEMTSEDLPIPLRSPVIAEAIRQLGRDEFQTRTGYSLDEGYALLEKVKKIS